MGITGLLPFLEKSSKKTNIREFSGSTVVIDSYCWLHKGVFSCAEKLMMGQTTDAYIWYCMKYINMLLQYKIKPILVFDGRRLPAKEQTEIKRRNSRDKNRRKAIELIQMGQVMEGKNLLKRAIDITHEIALELIKHCQKENIDCIVAPYEADAQLAYLNTIGIADVVITEDSDLTLFGCKKIFFKMDFNGNGVLIEQDRLYLAMNMRPDQFDMDKFRHICILSGCDYLPSLPGIGLRKAQKFIERNTDQNIHKALTRIGSILNIKSLVVTTEYRDAFVLADITFKHQLVFCPLQRKQVRLNSPTAEITEDQLRYAGTELNANIALQLALGNCDPSTLRIVHNFNPEKIERKRKRNAEMEQMILHTSIWSSKYKLKTGIDISENILNSSIKTQKESCIQRHFLKDENVSLKLHTNSTMQYDKFPEYQYLNKNAILDMYNSNQDTNILTPEKLTPEKRSEEYLDLIENNVSPELFKKKNPFVKRVSDLTTSPSVLSNENCRKKGRNLMRIRRTIVDENIVESKYFLKHDNEKCNELKQKKSIENLNLKSTKYNVNSIIDISLCDANIKQEKSQDLKIFSVIKNSNLTSKGINDMPQSDLNKSLINSENLSEKPYSNNKITEISPMQHLIINNSYIFNNLSNSDTETISNTISYENTSNLQDNSFKLSNRKNSPFSHKRSFKKISSTNLVLHANSVTEKKQSRHSKQLISNPRRQSLLSMYGFQKRSTFKY